jgi:oligosaccharide reducing-end xylanase
MLGTPFMVMSTCGAHLIRADGSPRYSMCCNLAGALLNIALDAQWSGSATPWQAEEAEKLQRFYLSRPDAMTDTVVNIDGTPYPEAVMHPLGLLSTAAAASAARPVNADSEALIRRFMDAEMRADKRRYYDNCLYFFSLLALSGRYAAILPSE